MFKQIKEHIEDFIASVQEERKLKRYLAMCEKWNPWRLENLYFPDMHKLNAFNVREWRN